MPHEIPKNFIKDLSNKDKFVQEIYRIIDQLGLGISKSNLITPDTLQSVS